MAAFLESLLDWLVWSTAITLYELRGWYLTEVAE